MNETLEVQRHAINIGSNAMNLAQQLGYPDLHENLQEMARRVADPLSRVVVCGGFKQGKSSLVNALLNGRLSPSDPAIATAISLTVADGDGEAALYLGRQRGHDSTEPVEPTVARIDLADVPAAMRGEIGDVGGREVTGALVRVRRGLLTRGIILVDTPPVTGGLASRAAVAVMTEIRRARGFIYVTDASQELTAPELEFIAEARRVCPAMVCCLTKTDLYPEWQRIAETNRAHLATIGVTTPVLPVSSRLRERAVQLDREDIHEASGYPLISSFLTQSLLGDALRGSIRVLAEASARAAASMAEPLVTELKALEQPNELAALREKAEAAKQRLAAFAEGGRSWERVLEKELRRMSGDGRFHVQVALKELERWAMERIDEDDPARFWSDFEGRLQRETTQAIVEHLAFIRETAEATVDKVAEAMAQDARDFDIDLEDFRLPFSADDLGLDDTQFGDSLHGAQSGVLALRFAGAAALTVAGTVATFGLGAIVGGFLVAGTALGSGTIFALTGKRSGIEKRRHAARQSTQRYLRDARLVVEKASSDAVSFTQDQLIEQFERLVRELGETVDAELRALAEAEQRHETETPARIEAIKTTLGQLKLVHAHAQRAAADARR